MQVGVQKARQIAAQHGAKYIPVHHMEAHALIARAGTAVQFPYLCLLVSGGHNMIVVVEGVGSYTLLGSTLDDAVGEPVSLLHDHRESRPVNWDSKSPSPGPQIVARYILWLAKHCRTRRCPSTMMPLVRALLSAQSQS